ncbi:MAG: PhzF family phenazine biosynthesis protein, partial [Coprothermobacterota bacterium]|nr:PhzF family phenazine biosynthesis protein [Coprothermobacterota bacterium]
MKYPYCIVYAFGDRSGRGNPAGVVTNARGLSDAEMQTIARLNNLSETAFL